MFGNNSITYILLAIILVIAIYMIINKFIKKKKQKDNFNKFVKPSIKERLKKDGYANHSYEIVHRYHHSLTSQNKEGRVDLILKVVNPKLGKSSEKTLGYTLEMEEVQLNKKEFIWEVKTIYPIKVEEIETLLKEKEERKKHRIKYLTKDIKSYKTKTIESLKKLKPSKNKENPSFKKKLTKTMFKKTNVTKTPPKNNEEEAVKNPFDVL